jgi:hypothetical protein
MTDYSDPMNTDPPPFPEFVKDQQASRTPADSPTDADWERVEEINHELAVEVINLKAENDRLTDQVVSLKGLLAEWLIAYQDAASPAIQDALKRGRAAISSTVPRAEQ